MYQVVIVEDDPMVAMLNRRFTEKDPRFQVVKECSSGREAWDYLSRHPADLVILDMYMPQMNGLETLLKLRRQGMKADVIMITAANDGATVEEAMHLGVMDYLVKPFAYPRFRQALETFILRRSAMERESISQEELDQFLRVNQEEPVSQETVLPKGLQEKTLHKVQEFLALQTTGLTCEQIAAGIGLSAVTVRHYMHYLVQSGEAISQVDYFTGGRPSILYSTRK